MSNKELIAEARATAKNERQLEKDDWPVYKQKEHADQASICERLADALEATLKAAANSTSQLQTDEGRASVLALAEYIEAHYPTAEPDIAKAALATIKALEAAESPTTVEWAIKWDEHVEGLLDFAVGFDSEALAAAALARSGFGGAVVSRTVSASDWQATE